MTLPATLGLALVAALQTWDAPEQLLVGRDITACAYSQDGASVFFSWARTPGEVRRFTPPAPGGAPLLGDETELVTIGTCPRPFGNRLLFVRRGNARGGLWVRDLGTGEEVQMKRDPFVGLPPAVSADGTAVIVSRWAGQSQRLGTVDPGTGAFRTIPGKDMGQPALDASGDRLLYVRAGQVWLRDLRSERDVQLTQGELTHSWPAWAPQGDRAAFCAQAKEGACGIGVVGLADGSVSWPALRLERASCPAFSPDGKSVIYLCATADGYDTAIWRVSVSAGPPSPGTPRPGP